MAIRAVLVGVDVYARADVAPLRGCVNDVALVRWVLKHFFGVPNEDIRVLVNQRATKANIMHRLAHMAEEAKRGDTLVFYFSGHGSQIRDRDGDELTDWLDELLCPYDMDWDSETYILDDDLDAVFAEIPSGVLLEAFLDCCFWGAGAREHEAGPRPQSLRADVRYLPPPLDIVSRLDGEEEHVAHHEFFDCECFSGRNVLWAASAEGEPAAEDYFGGRVQGVFTYWGCRFLAQRLARGRSYTRAELAAHVRTYVGSLGYAQSPELSASEELRAAAPFLAAAERSWLQWGRP